MPDHNAGINKADKAFDGGLDCINALPISSKRLETPLSFDSDRAGHAGESETVINPQIGASCSLWKRTQAP